MRTFSEKNPKTGATATLKISNFVDTSRAGQVATIFKTFVDIHALRISIFLKTSFTVALKATRSVSAFRLRPGQVVAQVRILESLKSRAQ